MEIRTIQQMIKLAKKEGLKEFEFQGLRIVLGDEKPKRKKVVAEKVVADTIPDISTKEDQDDLLYYSVN